MSNVYTQNQANTILENATNGAYSIKSGYRQMTSPAYIYNHNNGKVEYNTPAKVRSRYQNQQQHSTNFGYVRHKNQNIVPITNDMKPNHIVSGGYYFLTLIHNDNHYIRVPNILNYLNINSSSFNRINSELGGKDTIINITPSEGANEITNNVLSFGGTQKIASFIKVKNLYKTLNTLIFSKNRIHFNRDHAKTLVHDVYDNFKNEIEGLTNLQAALDKHNAKVDREFSTPKMPSFDQISAIRQKRSSVLAKIRSYRQSFKQYQDKIYEGFNVIKKIDRLLVLQTKSNKLYKELFSANE